MAENASESVNYFLCIKSIHVQRLAEIRQWPNLKAAFQNDELWVTNFTADQIQSVEVKSIPYTSLFYEKLNQLYPYNSLLPKGQPPSLLWSPIEIALPLKIEQFNHNYFGVEESIDMKLVPNASPKIAKVMVLNITDLLAYAEKAPEIRLISLEWCILNDQKAMVFGESLLPLNAEVFWVSNQMIMPIGFDFDLSIIAPVLAEKILQGSNDWLVWSTESTYFRIPKDSIQQLSLSSIRLTISAIKDKQKMASET